MKQQLPRYLLGTLLLLLLMGQAMQIYRLELIERLDAIFYDAKVRLTLPNGIDERIVIVDIDEQSLAEQGRWPWGRDRLATLLDKLFDRYKVAIVGFDMVFAEPDDSSGIATLEHLAGGALRENRAFRHSLDQLRPQLNYDRRFAAALQGRKTVLGFYLSNNVGSQSSGVLPAPTFSTPVFSGAAVAVSQWQTAGGNLAELQASAAAAGHFNPLVDFDGVSRRIPLLAEYRGHYYESLSLAMLRSLFDFPAILPGFADREGHFLEWLELPTAQGKLSIPIDENVAALVPFRGPQGSFAYVSATDVLNDRLPTDRLSGKMVLVSTTTPGLVDTRATPVSAVYPGVEMHASLIAGMLDGTLRHQPAYLQTANALQILLAGGLMLTLIPKRSPLQATLASAAILGLLLGINLYLWQTAHLVMPFANVFIAVVLLYSLTMFWGHFVDAQSKRQLAKLFGQYIPSELVDEMARNPASYSMAGRKAELTVLFADIRGFTTLSEGLQPDDLAALMNEYLGTMTRIIHQHRGTLDKYIGDAIMAFWGAPLADPDHALHATMAALQMHRALRELNLRLHARGWPVLKVGIGINTGPMTVGDMGSPLRKAYTVMGDAVNLASRLEGITKHYGVGIIVGEGTQKLIGGRLVLREIDRVRVTGKRNPVCIYEPLGLPDQLDAPAIRHIDLWQRALAAYYRQDWASADRLLADLIGQAPHELYTHYAERIARHRQSALPESWDGVTTFETK